MEPDEATFDFESHRAKAVEAYQRVRPLYDQFSEIVRKILKDCLSRQHVKVASTEARAKDLESFGNKAVQSSSEDPNLPKYKEPLTEIKDLSGVRVITFFPKTVELVNRVIDSEFQVLEKSDKADILNEEEKFGYQSVHYLISLKDNRTALPEYAPFKNLIAEVQVRTILQHAWAEMEHDIQYKSVETTPKSIRRRFMSLAGLMEIADREFQAVQDEGVHLAEKARTSVQEGRLGEVEITADALRAYLDKKLWSDDRYSDWSYDWMAGILRKLGFTNFSQIDECISGYDDDALSRIVFGNRQGQLTRFELQLIAGMGENYLNGHPSSNNEWYVSKTQHSIETLTKNGVPIRHYQTPAQAGRPEK